MEDIVYLLVLISVTLSTFHLLTSPLNTAAPTNTDLVESEVLCQTLIVYRKIRMYKDSLEYISVTLATFHLLESLLKFSA